MRQPVVISYRDVTGKTGEQLDRLFQKKNAFTEINPGKVLMPHTFKKIGQEILDLPVSESDVFLCSYPRTGSTWAQEMVWLIGHDLDYEGAKTMQQVRCPLLELTAIVKEQHEEWHEENLKGETSVDLIKRNMPHPRYLRCHLPCELLPMDIYEEDGSFKSKVIYTTRNPKDMCVSFYHYCSLVHKLQGSFEEFCELFLTGTCPVGPVWNHILGFWSRRNDPNLLFLKYEDMKRDLPSVAKKTAAFLGKTLTDEQIEVLCDYLSFDKMKNNRAVNLEPIIEQTNGKQFLQENKDSLFIRKGQIGDWKNHMSEEMAKRFDDWTAEHTRGTGLTYE